MKKYVLVEVIEREISTPEFFDTYEDAYKKMKKYYNEANKYAEDGDISEDCAWVNVHHDNFDWRIFELEA